MRSGRLDAWGSNQHAQCTVPAGNDFLVVDGGWTFSIALQSDGFLWAWGNNEDKELDVPGGNDYKAIAAGGVHAIALRR